MDNETIRIAISLRLGSSVGLHHCETEVSQFATYGLTYCWSEDHHHRHVAINDTLHRARSHIPSTLESSHLVHTDGKSPDGVTMVPWKCVTH